METIDIYKDKVNCNLCGKLMTVYQWEQHYDKCLMIGYLVSVAKKKGLDFTRKDLEEYGMDSLNKLYEKYPPETNHINKG